MKSRRMKPVKPARKKIIIKNLDNFTKKWECDTVGDVCEKHTFRWVNEKEKMIWWEVPRSGSSKLSRTFDHMHWLRINRDQVDDISYEDYFNFATTCNPWRRVASSHWLFNNYKRRIAEGKHLKCNVEFPEFVHNMFTEGFRNHHWYPTSCYTPPEDAPFDFTIIRLENLTEEWNKIAKKYDQPLMVTTKERHAAHNPTPWHTIYEKYPNVVAAVQEHYKEDIRRFGYNYENEVKRSCEV